MATAALKIHLSRTQILELARQLSDEDKLEYQIISLRKYFVSTQFRAYINTQFRTYPFYKAPEWMPHKKCY